MFKFYSVLFFLFVVSPTFVLADPTLLESSANTLSSQTSLALPEVVITANRLDTPVSQVAKSLTVITAKDLERRQAGTVYEGLQTVPGMDLVKNGGPGETSSLFIRGANAEHTLVLMDGIPLNDPLSTTREYDDLDQLGVECVKQIEVVRGAESPLYGSSAMGGVVNIITQDGPQGFGGSMFFEGGAYSTFREALTAGGGDKGSNFFLTASRFDSAGFPSADRALGNTLNNSDQNSTGSLKLGFSPTSNFSGNLLIHYNQSRTSLDDFGGAGGDNPNYFVDGKQFLAGSQSKWKLLNGDWEQVLNLSFGDHLRVYTNDPSVYQPFDYERGHFDGQDGQVSWQNNLKLSPGETLVVGLQGQQEWGNSLDTNSYGTSALMTTAQMGSLFVESQTALGDRFFETLGGRLDLHSQFGAHSTYQAGLAYFIPDLNTKLKATYGTGFRAPSLYQLYAPNPNSSISYGNSNLQPETSTSFDVGFEQPFGGKFLVAGATYFHNDFNQLIDFDFVSSQYFNIHQARADGVEAFADFKGVPQLEVKANYTFTDAHDTQSGQPLLRRPQNKAGLDAFYTLGALELGTSLVYMGDRNDVSFPPPLFTEVTVVMPSYFLANVMASFKFSDQLMFFGRVNNLLNTSYEEVYGFGTPGLSVYAGTKVSL